MVQGKKRGCIVILSDSEDGDDYEPQNKVNTSSSRTHGNVNKLDMDDFPLLQTVDINMTKHLPAKAQVDDDTCTSTCTTIKSTVANCVTGCTIDDGQLFAHVDNKASPVPPTIPLNDSSNVQRPRKKFKTVIGSVRAKNTKCDDDSHAYGNHVTCNHKVPSSTYNDMSSLNYHPDKFDVMKNTHSTIKTMQIYVQVNGKPKPLKRHRASATSGGMHMYDPSKADKNEFLMKACLNAPPPDLSTVDAKWPIRTTLEFIFQRPKTHFKGGKHNNHLLKPHAPIHHTSTPDVDNLVKFVLDALNGTYYTDDAQITCISASKRWTTTSSTTALENDSLPLSNITNHLGSGQDITNWNIARKSPPSNGLNVAMTSITLEYNCL